MLPYDDNPLSVGCLGDILLILVNISLETKCGLSQEARAIQFPMWPCGQCSSSSRVTVCHLADLAKPRERHIADRAKSPTTTSVRLALVSAHAMSGKDCPSPSRETKLAQIHHFLSSLYPLFALWRDAGTGPARASSASSPPGHVPGLRF